ncbi:MAG: hypothetical protein LH628_21505 [Microcoleus sp. CAN_BIN18]|nr:hypothetical protein [Microcoleus sp. CAN_BIN18]
MLRLVGNVIIGNKGDRFNFTSTSLTLPSYRGVGILGSSTYLKTTYPSGNI